MKIRLMGTKTEIETFLQMCDQDLLDEVSTFYPNRGNSKLGRVYVETHIDTTKESFVKERLPTKPKITKPWWNWGLTKKDDQDIKPMEVVIPYHPERR